MDKCRALLYLGNAAAMVKCLLASPYFTLNGILCEKRKMSDELSRIARENNIIVYEVEKKADIAAIFQDTGMELAVMYDFGIIIPETLVNKVHIFNFHPGSLKTNRGSSPVNWSVLLGDRQGEISLHKISKEIDAGILIAARQCDIYWNDTPGMLRSRLESFIGEMLCDLYRYLEGEIQGEIADKGIYRRRIEESDYTIRPAEDSLLRVNAKIRSQEDYKGAVLYVGTEKRYVKSWRDLIAALDEITI